MALPEEEIKLQNGYAYRNNNRENRSLEAMLDMGEYEDGYTLKEMNILFLEITETILTTAERSDQLQQMKSKKR